MFRKKLPKHGYTSAETVRRNYKINHHNRWASVNPKHEFTAQNRFSKDFFHCASNINGQKRFSRDSKVFTMGSCFARYIEIALRENKISVLSDKLSIDPSLYTGPRSASAALNKFNIPSMKNEFLKSLGHLEINGDPFIKVRDDQYFDTSTAGLILAPYEVLLSLQHQIAEFNKQILEADLFVCTLGLVEMFVDNETGCVLNTSPHPLCMKKYRGRFDHFRPDYGYLRTELADMLDLLAQVNPSLEVVVTVSPVPLQSTMTSDDVVVSNTLSKSLLRVVAQEASEERDNVSYFPSFEMVMNSPRGLTWEDDCIHVRSEVVKLVTSSFIENWFH